MDLGFVAKLFGILLWLIGSYFLYAGVYLTIFFKT